MAADLRYPIGSFAAPAEIGAEQRADWIADLERLPRQLRDAVQGLTTEQIATPYRRGGWSVRQVVHHVPESHMHAYLRCKLALTEESPRIKPYDESRCAELEEVRLLPLEVSLTLLEALHQRWVTLLRSLSDEQFRRAYLHPEQDRLVSVAEATGSYAWHGRHHLAHITSLREREGW
jgi:hypothetical protein